MPKNLVLCFEGYYKGKHHADTHPLHNLEAFLTRSSEQLIHHPAALNKNKPTREDFERSLNLACKFLAGHFQEGDRVFIFATGNGIDLASDLVAFLSTYGFYQEHNTTSDKKPTNKDLVARYSQARTANKATNQSIPYALLNRITKGSVKPTIQFLGHIAFDKDQREANLFTEPGVFEPHPGMEREYIFITGQTGVIKNERNLHIKTEINLEKAVGILKSAALKKGLFISEEPHPNSFFARKGKLDESSSLLSEKKKARCTIL